MKPIKPKISEIRALGPFSSRVTLEPLERGFWPHLGEFPASCDDILHSRLCPH